MTFAELGTQLNALKIGQTPMKFAHFAWASAPSGDYGIYGEDGGNQFDSNDGYAERAMTGSVDWYTRSDNEQGKDQIETLFKSLQTTNTFAWYLNTIQYEDSTHFLHYEWVVEVG